MSSEPDYWIFTSYVLGALICALKAIYDFKASVPFNQTSKLRIWIHTLFFTSVILVVYVGLVNVLVGLAPQFEPPFVDIRSGRAEFENYRIIAPIIIAILFFGATQATIKLYGKDIHVYESLLQVFARFLAVPFEKQKILDELTNREIESLEDFHAEVFRDSMTFGIGQRRFDNEVARVKSSLDKSNDRIQYLEQLRTRGTSLGEAISKLEDDVDQQKQNYVYLHFQLPAQRAH